MGKSHSQLRFKSQFELIWRLDLNCKDSTTKIGIQFEIRFEIFGIRFEKDVLNHDKSAACLPVRNGMHESSKHLVSGAT